uniref:ribosomal protein L32 n=1 Tax=Hypnea musciformis TaxID=31429 RepID=UPI0027D9DF2B|nr:ribosomal protein L32 [Hypnea musciformis]WCH56838.1 ribosomal protein L32 [Hypnea musciformis]
MAVPKKRTSKSKSKSRKANWKHKAHAKSQQALSLAKSLLNGKNSQFIYIDKNNLSDNKT